MTKFLYGGALIIILSITVLATIPSYGDTSGSIAATFVYTNGDTADYWPISLKIYQDYSQTPYKEIASITGNPFNIVSLPISHQYKIVAYANSMHSSVAYVNLQQPHQDVTINLPLPGGMRINAFYNDGVTPIANATVYVRSQDNKTWGYSSTNSIGDSLRFWIEPTTVQGDHYIADVNIGNHLTYSSSPIFLGPGIAQEIKITTNWPPVVNSLITAKVLNAQSHPVSPLDGKFSVDLFDSSGNKISESPVTSRGEAYFSNLKVGYYTFKVIKTDDNSAWGSANMTEDGLLTSFQIPAIQKAPVITPPILPPVPTPTPHIVQSCNCVAFRLDNVQDYWLDNVQIKVIDSFDNKDAGLTIGVIGKAFGNDSKLVSYLKSKTQTGKIDIAVNGWNFEDFTTLDQHKQQQLLEQSKNKILSSLGITPSVFIPPYGKVNNKTFFAMSDSGINFLSANLDTTQLTNIKKNIRNFPSEVNGVYSIKQNNTNDVILSDIKNAINRDGFAIVTISFQDYAQSNGTIKINTPDPEKIQNLRSLIDDIRNNNYQIVTIKDIANPLSVPEFGFLSVIVLMLSVISILVILSKSNLKTKF